MKTNQPHFILTAVNNTKFINITWNCGLKNQINHFWLRDNCGCATCGDHESGSRFLLWTTLPPDIAPKSISWNQQYLSIVWNSEEHVSEYCLDWLFSSCNFKDDLESFTNDKILWNYELTHIPTVDFQTAVDDENELFKLLDNVSKYGFVLVKNVGVRHAATTELANLIGFTRKTHFGEVTDLQLRSAGQHLSDYPLEITQHTDETYRPTPTGINIFHCIVPSSDGGGVTSLTDSFSCAIKLQQNDQVSFNLLTKTPVRHARRTDNELIVSNHPPLLLDCLGRLSEIRLNERTMSAIRVAPELVEQVYSALRNLLAIAYSGDFTVSYLMQAGDALVFDNLRVLHGRSKFLSERHIRQTNVMRDEFYARHTYLAKKLYHSAKIQSQKRIYY